MTTTPYYALTPELTRDYNERASLTSIRMVFSVFGYILGAALTTILADLFQGAGLDMQAGLERDRGGLWSGCDHHYSGDHILDQGRSRNGRRTVATASSEGGVDFI